MQKINKTFIKLPNSELIWNQFLGACKTSQNVASIIDLDPRPLLYLCSWIYVIYFVSLYQTYSLRENVLVLLHGHPPPLLLTLFLIELSKHELGSFNCPKDHKCHLVLQKCYQRIELFVYIMQYVWRKSYHTGNTPADFEGSVCVLCLRYCSRFLNLHKDWNFFR